MTLMTFVMFCESASIHGAFPLSYLCTVSNTTGICFPNIELVNVKYPRYVYDIQTIDNNTVIETTPVMDDDAIHMHKYRCYLESHYTRCVSMYNGHQTLLRCSGNDDFKICSVGIDLNQ